MLSVDIEKIIPVTEARDMFNKIIDEVEGSDELYVLTKNGKPAAVVVGINHLEKLTGESDTEVQAKINQAGQKEVGSADADGDDQFMTPNSADPKPDGDSTEPPSTTLADDALTSPADSSPAPAKDMTPEPEAPAPADTSLGNLSPSAPAATPVDPFMPQNPPSGAQPNPPGSTGGIGANSDPMQPSVRPDPNTDTINPTDNSAGATPLPPNPQV